MGEVRNGLMVALRTLVGVPCNRSLATNSLMLRFDFSARVKGRAYIWIDPPWRLTLDGGFVTGSGDWPPCDQGGEDVEVKRALWEAWCALLDPLNDTTLTHASVDAAYPDLHLRFESGHVIETFGNTGDGCWWYYRDRVTGEVFEAGAAGVVHEFGEPADDPN